MLVNFKVKKRYSCTSIQLAHCLILLVIFAFTCHIASGEVQQPQQANNNNQGGQIENIKNSNNNVNNEGTGLKRTAGITLFYSKECQEDIARFCPNAQKGEMTDLSVLRCIHNQVSDFNLINQQCHNLLYDFKKNLTLNLKFGDTALNICNDDIKSLSECKNADPSNGHLTSCLLDNLENITSNQCRVFLYNIAAFVFSDFRLVSNFVQDCSKDIQKYQCGRLEKASENLPTQQGKTIECLSNNLNSLENTCRKQILRIAELQSDDFTLDRVLYFACRDDRERFCEQTPSGKGRVIKCLMLNKFNQLMSKECQAQLTRIQKIYVEDVKADKTLIRACKKDLLNHHCRKELRGDGSDTFKLAGIILCLENALQKGESVDPECQAEIIDRRKMFMSDYKLSPDLVKECSAEINKYCDGGIERDGKTVHCLFRSYKYYLNKPDKNRDPNDFKSGCIQQLRVLVQIANAGEDIRVDPHLRDACQNLISGPCKDITPGRGRVIQCLLEFVGTDQINDDCQERLIEIQFFVARDWKLNPGLFKACRIDAATFCSAKKDWFDGNIDVGNGPLVLPCLYHHMHADDDDDDDNDGSKNNDNSVQISIGCQREVKKVMRIRAKSIDLIPEIQDNCSEDLGAFCSHESHNSNVKGEELRCLQKNYKKLQDTCRDSIKKYTKYENKDISLDEILMKSCWPIIDEFCASEKDEKSELLACLIKQKNNPKINEKCKAGIEHHQLVNLENIDFNIKFKKACKPEIKEHCSTIKTKPEIISCLSDILLQDTLLDSNHRITNKCRQQLRFELLQQNENINLDPEMVEKCKSDISTLCKDVKSGQGQVLECLKAHSKDLTQECKDKLYKRDKLNLVDQSVDYALFSRCKNAITQFCHVGSDEDVISCLRKHLLKPDLEGPCRMTVINRIMSQNKDARLNPTLWKSCKHDVVSYCHTEFSDQYDLTTDLNGRVLKCLKRLFVKNSLSKRCEVEVEQVMREAANVDVRLDPLLVENCLKELETLCNDEPNDKKEDCLRLAFQRQSIQKNSKCFDEVRRLIIEGAADVFVDHELTQECANDLARYCSDVPPGASQQLKCLLNSKNKAKQFSETCSELLEKRQELWKLADVSDTLSGINDLARLVNESHHKSYLFIVFFTFIISVFLLGCCCKFRWKNSYRKKL